MIVVDVETTGLDPQKHSIVSIGAIDFNNPTNEYYCVCSPRPGARIDPKALKVNGLKINWFRMEHLARVQKSLEAAVANFFCWTKFIEDRTLAGTNIDFDQDFLQDAAKRYGLEWPFGYRVVDLHAVCYSHHLSRGIDPPLKDGKSALSNNEMLKYVGLPEEPEPHTALRGAKMEAEAFSRLIYRRSILEEFSKYEIPKYL